MITALQSNGRRPLVLTSGFALLGLLGGLSSAQSPMPKAAEWPEFRGPSREGHSQAQGLPLQWSAKGGPEVRWQAALPGVGWSSPVVADGRIYLTTAVPQGEVAAAASDANSKAAAKAAPAVAAPQSLRALCLDGQDGRVIWSREVFVQSADAPNIHRKNSHASPTALYEDGRVYVHFGHQGTACLDARDGAVIWSTREFAYKPRHGNGGSPVIEGDLLIFNADAEENPGVIALEKASGKLRWRFDRHSDAKAKFSFCTPLVIEVKGQRQLITPGSGVVNALEPATGREIWKVRYGNGYSVVPRPVFAHGMIFISTGYDKPKLLAIRVDGKGDVTDSHVAWTLEKYAPHNPSMVVVGDELYLVADNGILSCVDARSGSVHYQERCTGPISASILHADGRLYLQDEKGLGVVVQPGKTFKVLSSNDLAQRSLASYAVMGRDLLIRTEQALWRIGKP